MKRWVLICMLIGISCAILFTGQKVSFAGFEGTLLGLNLSVAVLAINFSFIAYQSSEYRQFQRGLSPNLLIACVFILVWALVPTLLLVFARPYVGLFALGEIPITCLFSIFLVEFAKYEGSPETLIENLAATSNLMRAFKDYSKIIDRRKSEWKNQKLPNPEDMPMHEWSWVPLPPPSKLDPFFLLGSIGQVASKASNASVLVLITQKLLLAYNTFYKVQNSKGSNFALEAGVFIEAQIERLCHASESDPTGYLSSKFLDVCSIHLIDESNTRDPNTHAFSFVARLMADSGKRMIEKGHIRAALIPLIAIRQCCIRGVYEIASRAKDGKKPDIDSFFFDYYLSDLASLMKPLGTKAIASHASDYLYRVFDAFGWLGCTALKNENRFIAKSCLRALSQLGREARAKGIECHWDSCALLPEHHAKERILWIASWISKAPETSHDIWLSLCSQALSRINGTETSLKIEKTNEKIQNSISESDNPHIESFSSNAGYRKLDYSNIQMLKDFELHGSIVESGSIVIQGPTVPLKSS